MCNFMGVTVSKIEFVRLKNIEKKAGTLAALMELQTYLDGFKYGNVAMLRQSADNNDFDIVPAHWEFIPKWVKNEEELKEQRKKGIPWLNAKAENLLVNSKGQKSMWADSARYRRSLIIGSHFFEWRHYKPDGEKKAIAYPYLIGLNESDYFYMAGIWTPWTDQSTGITIDTCAIVTTEANELMAEIHNTKQRMPTILPDNLAWEWVMDDLRDERILEIGSYQLPSEAMRAHTVQKDFKTADDPCKEFEYSELPPLDIAL